jgi:hypothetical protein
MSESDETRVEFGPKGMKATCYSLNVYGILFRAEHIVLSCTRSGKREYDQEYTTLLFREPGKRRLSYYNRIGVRSQFLFAIEGWGHPDGPTFTPTTPVPIHDRLHYKPYLARVREWLLEHSQKTGRKLLVDVHDAITAPYLMPQVERLALFAYLEAHWPRLKSGDVPLDALKTDAAKHVFTVPGEADLMLGEPVFEQEIQDRLAYLEHRDKYGDELPPAPDLSEVSRSVAGGLPNE